MQGQVDNIFPCKPLASRDYPKGSTRLRERFCPTVAARHPAAILPPELFKRIEEKDKSLVGALNPAFDVLLQALGQTLT